MRFDDSLTTVLAAETASANGAQAAWRQLVDLAGRGRVADIDAAVARLAALRPDVAAGVRAASARALAFARPPAALVAFFAADSLAVAAPVLRTAELDADAWLALLPRLTPELRSVLRHRRDLPADVVRGLEAFGATDFVLGHDAPATAETAPALPAPRPVAPLDTTPFVSVAEAARAIPLVAEALGRTAEPAPRFEIAELVARIDAFQRARPAPSASPPAAPDADRFRFATDAAGVIRWVEGVPRGPLIGATLAHARPQGVVQLDAAPGGALRRRAAFRDARLEVGGVSAAAGTWRLAAEPVFDAASGRFAGMRGVARRPHPHETAAPAASASDQLRQLVHELRTPMNAIAGFAELIGSELLGPVAPVYRERAAGIQRQAGDLLAAIDDLDAAARIEGGALELRPGQVDLAELVRHAAEELTPLMAERGATVAIDAGEPALAAADERAATRLVSRLLATLIAAAQAGERLRVQVAAKTRTVRVAVTRPRGLAVTNGGELLAIDAESEDQGGPLLGAGFTLRLLRNLAAELGGRLTIEDDRLTLRLPAAFNAEVEQAAAQ
ncbi:sensor histidine kinase [uncultured Sphingomonas sp.]|uniref:sensor histidine kinase n=1 Tax=uncultured Sphingomonas sp. TaxID=158754 RepID=UPI0035CC1CD9